MAYNDIVRALGVSKSSVSLWVRDLPRLSPEEVRRRHAGGAGSYWCDERPRRRALREAVSAEAAAGIGEVSDRDVLIAGTVAYWCEGSKAKPGRSAERVVFSNSDPGLIRLFLRFLAIAGTSLDLVTCRLQIHETADLADALQFWRAQTGLRAQQFARPTLKPSRADTVRKNTGPGYHGCLAVSLRQSRELYRQIEGWAAATLSGRDGPQQLVVASERASPGQPRRGVPDGLRDRAVALRLAGRSRKEIGAALGIQSISTLNEALGGVPPPTWAGSLGYAEYRSRQTDGLYRYWETERLSRAQQRRSLVEQSAAQIGTLTRREALISGAIAYWCEGSKNKPYRREDRVAFVNSDPMIIKFFLNFLAMAGVAPDRVVCRVLIHQGAEVEAAEQFWRAASGLPACQFRRPTLKRHTPKTVRTGHQNDDYHGCLVLSVLGSSQLYREIEGWAAAVMARGR